MKNCLLRLLFRLLLFLIDILGSNIVFVMDATAPYFVCKLFLFTLKNFYYQEFAEETESEWLRQNNELTTTRCRDLLEALRVQILDPVLERLTGSEIAMVSCEDLYFAYKSVEEEFKLKSEGPRNLRENYATIFRMVRGNIYIYIYIYIYMYIFI